MPYYIIAQRYLDNNTKLNLNILNQLLRFEDNPITEKEFEYLKSIKSVNIETLPPLKKDPTKYLKALNYSILMEANQVIVMFL